MKVMLDREIKFYLSGGSSGASEPGFGNDDKRLPGGPIWRVLTERNDGI
jgi:hypothetical protein